MTARSDSVIEANYALAGALAAMEGRLTQLVDSIRGQVVNGVLFAGTVVLDANGIFTIDFEVPFGSVAVGNNSTGTVTFQNEGQQSSAPTNGIGVFTIGAGKASTFPIAGRALTVYGPVGGVVQLSVYDRPLGAAALGPVSASGVSPTTVNDSDANASFTGAGSAVAHNYGFNGATWDRVRATAATDGLNVAVGALYNLAFNSGYNGATWDRLRNALGARVGASPSFALHVAAGAPPASSLAAVTTTGAGTALDNQTVRKDHSLQITGTAVGASVNFEVNLDGSTWVPVTPTAVPGGGGTVVGSAATTNGLYTISIPARQVRANLTAITSGALTATAASA